MRLKLLVDSAEFWSSLEPDIASSRRRVYVQALSFEGDSAGKGLAEALLAAPAPDRRAVVDNYTKYDQGDKFLYYPPHLFDRALRSLVHETRRMFEKMEAGGVQVKFTNPVGFLLRRFPVRNHKKLALIDDRVAYIGGFNFADLNFRWRDMMLRIEDPEIVAVLAEDFLSTWEGRNLSGAWQFEGLELHLLDGPTNPDRFDRVFDLIGSARERIYVESPALTQPFVGHLEEASRRGVAVTVMTPEVNNWGLMKDYMNWLAATSGLEIRFYQRRLTHLKAMLIDDRCLIMGSANFDPWSYWFQQEHLAVVRDPGILADFEQRVVETGLRDSVAGAPSEVGIRERLSAPQLDALESLSLLVNGGWATRRLRRRGERPPVELGLSPEPIAEGQNEGSGD